MCRVREKAFTVPSRRREQGNEEEVIEMEVDAVEEEVKKNNKGKRGLPREIKQLLSEAAKSVRFILSI